MPGSTGEGAHLRGGKKKASTVCVWGGVGERPSWPVHSLQGQDSCRREQELLCRDYS